MLTGTWASAQVAACTALTCPTYMLPPINNNNNNTPSPPNVATSAPAQPTQPVVQTTHAQVYVPTDASLLTLSASVLLATLVAVL